MRLIKPDIKFKNQYLQALKEAEKDLVETSLAKPGENQSFEDFIQEMENNSKGKKLPPGYVPATTFWLIDNDEFIGRVQIRHGLNEHLLKFGGHIGYYVRLSKRSLGYGKKILQLALIEAKKMGILKILIACDIDNTASKKIIEACGGVFESSLKQGNGRPDKLRYWIIEK